MWKREQLLSHPQAGLADRPSRRGPGWGAKSSGARPAAEHVCVPFWIPDPERIGGFWRWLPSSAGSSGPGGSPHLGFSRPEAWRRGICGGPLSHVVPLLLPCIRSDQGHVKFLHHQQRKKGSSSSCYLLRSSSWPAAANSLLALPIIETPASQIAACYVFLSPTPTPGMSCHSGLLLTHARPRRLSSSRASSQNVARLSVL